MDGKWPTLEVPILEFSIRACWDWLEVSGNWKEWSAAVVLYTEATQLNSVVNQRYGAFVIEMESAPFVHIEQLL